jgi:hypothetical protein
MLYEDPTKNHESQERFHIELHFSPGVPSLQELTNESFSINEDKTNSEEKHGNHSNNFPFLIKKFP